MIADFLLVQKIRNGDNQAGNQLVEKYYSSIYQYCYLHTHNQEYAEDMVQETFERFFGALISGAEIKKTKSYLYSIAGNIIKNNYKKKKEIMTDQLPDIEDENPKNIEIRIDIERALEQLPEEIKEIVILFFFQGLKQKEIADLLNIKLSLVKYRVSKSFHHAMFTHQCRNSEKYGINFFPYSSYWVRQQDELKCILKVRMYFNLRHVSASAILTKVELPKR